MPTWPTALRDNFLRSGFTMQPLANALPIEVESGEPMTRLRFTGDLSDVSGALPLVGLTQVEIFRNFWTYDLNRGALRFTWSDQMSGAAVEYLFMAPPRYSNVGGDNWQADLMLRMFA